MEYLSARLCEHQIFSDLRLWQRVLSVDLEKHAVLSPNPSQGSNREKTPPPHGVASPGD